MNNTDPMRYIKFIGIELEGAYREKPISSTIASVHADPSISSLNPCKCGARQRGESCTSSLCGKINIEVVSIPLDSLEKALSWTSDYYPLKSDKSCGAHFHVSFKENLSYMRLMSKNFYNYFLTQVTAWGVEKQINEGTIFWERLTGQNRFCTKTFIPEKQIKHERKMGEERWTHLNYCYKQHGTIECRLFPTFQKKELTLSALSLYVNIINNYLDKPFREKAIEISLVDEESPLVKGNLICV